MLFNDDRPPFCRRSSGGGTAGIMSDIAAEDDGPVDVDDGSAGELLLLQRSLPATLASACQSRAFLTFSTS